MARWCCEHCLPVAKEVWVLSRRKSKQLADVPTHIWWFLGLLVILGVAAYWNSLNAPFVFDDLASIQRNSNVRFGAFDWHLLNDRSILYLTFTLNSVIGQQNVWGYHLVNLFFHLMNGVLLFFIADHIFNRVGKDPRSSHLWALLASAFFLLHPIQTESVTYVSSRSELLSTAFYLIGFLLFIKWPERRIGFFFGLLMAVPFFLGLGSKETVISLPATAFLYDFIFLSGGSFRPMLSRWRFYALFVLGGAAAGIFITTVSLRGAIGPSIAGGTSPAQYFLTQSRVIVRYIFLTFLPIGQNLDYDFRLSTSFFEPAVIASFCFLGCLLVLAWRIRKQFPIFAFSLFWFFLTLAPTSSVIPIPDFIFEHRLYLPLAGVCLSFPGAIDLFVNALKSWFDWRLKPMTVSAIILASLMTATVLRNQVWGDEVRLFTDVVDKSPHKARAQNGLIFAYYKRGQFDQAIDVAQKALDLVPNRNDMADNLGNLYLRLGKFDEAAQLFRGVVDDPSPSRSAFEYNNLGVSYLWKWQTVSSSNPDQSAALAAQMLPPALDAFKKAVAKDPSLFTALDALIDVSSDLGLQDQLESEALTRLREGEKFRDLYIVGKIAYFRKDFARADEFFTKAEKLNSDEKLVYFNHAYALDKLDQKDRAIEKYMDALRLDPIFTTAHHNLALIYKERKDYAKATENFLDVLRYDPNNPLSNINLAEIAAAQGDKAAARKYLKTVLDTSPGNQQAIQDWQRLGL